MANKYIAMLWCKGREIKSYNYGLVEESRFNKPYCNYIQSYRIVKVAEYFATIKSWFTIGRNALR